MAENDGKNQGQSTPSANPPKEEEPKEQTYELDYLVTNSRSLVGASRSVTAAALSSAKGNRKNFTAAEAKELVKQHRKRPVAVANVGDDA